MPQIRIPMSLDLVRPNSMIPYITKMGDSNSRYILATILNDGVKVDIPQCTVRGNFVNADGLGVYVAGSVVSNGQVEVMVPYGTFLKKGLMHCSISFVTSNPATRLSTVHFDMFVESAEEANVEIDPEEMDSYLDQIETTVAATVASAFINLVQEPGNNDNKIMSQKAVTDFVNEHGGSGGAGWTTAQIDIFEDAIDSFEIAKGGIMFTTQESRNAVNQCVSQFRALITSLRGSIPSITISVSGGNIVTNAEHLSVSGQNIVLS